MLNNKYDPRLKKFEELEQTFACGETILEELTGGLKPGKKKELSRQSWVITGARGAGKSHLLALLYYRVKKDKKLSKYWLPLLFPEELFGVDSLYRLMLQVLEHIFKSDGLSGLSPEFRKQFMEIKKIRITGGPKQKRETKHQLAKQLFELVVKIKSAAKKSFILMLENLQYLFREQLPADDVKVLRSFLNEHPGVFIITGTALTVFDELTDYGKPFYHFFRVRSMGSMERQEIIDFLLKVAAFREDKGIEERIEANRRYIYLYQLLTGGNPRLVLFLYELLLGNEILDTYMILGKIAELTPYFLDKTRDESGQRKLILDALATEAPAQTAREIAEHVNEDYKSIGEQLKRLSAEGWLREISIDAEGARKNEVFYTLRDYFYRLWYRTRTKGIEESDILCMAELVVFLFDRKEIEGRLKKYAGSNEETRTLYESSLQLVANELFMRNINILLKEVEKFERKDIKKMFEEMNILLLNRNWKKLINTVKTMLHYQKGKHFGYTLMGIGYRQLENHEEALECFKKAIEIKPDYYTGRYLLAISYYTFTQYDESYSAMSKAIKDQPQPPKNIFDTLYFYFWSEKGSKIAHEIFDSSKELQHLLDKKSSVRERYESLCRLLLLGKFPTLIDVMDKLLEEDNLALDEAKKMEFFLGSKIQDILKNRQQDPELIIYLKYWVSLVGKRYDEKTVREIFLQFIYTHIIITEKENVSLETVESICNQLYEEGIEISDIILKIIAAVKNPHTREAQQWMADPLFSEVVNLLMRNN